MNEIATLPRTSHTSTRIAALGLALATLAGISVTSCDEAPQFSRSRKLTSTVADSGHTLTIDTVIALELRAEPAATGLEITADLTLTASTATIARRLLDRFEVTVTSAGEDEQTVTITSPPNVALGGTLTIVTPPFARPVRVLQRAGTTLIQDEPGPIEVSSLESVRVDGARDDVAVMTSSGNVIIDASEVSGSHAISASVEEGDIEVMLAAVPDVAIEATVTTQGQIYPTHPRLPASFALPGETYQTILGLGSTTIQLSTSVGNIVIDQKR